MFKSHLICNSLSIIARPHKKSKKEKKRRRDRDADAAVDSQEEVEPPPKVVLDPVQGVFSSNIIDANEDFNSN